MNQHKRALAFDQNPYYFFTGKVDDIFSKRRSIKKTIKEEMWQEILRLLDNGTDSYFHSAVHTILCVSCYKRAAKNVSPASILKSLQNG